MKNRYYIVLSIICHLIYSSTAHAKAWWIFDTEDTSEPDTTISLEVYSGKSTGVKIGDTEKKCKAKGFGVNIQSCKNKNKNVGLLCPLNSNFTDQCCDKEYGYILTSSCINNTTPSHDTCGGRYKCICDPYQYPKGIGRDSCNGEFAYDEINYCIETSIDDNGTTHQTRYFRGCTCASNYARCNPAYHLHGVGEPCRDGNNSYYTRCVCDAGFNKLCMASGAKYPNDYCLFNGKRYYRECNQAEADDKTNDSEMSSTEQ